MLLKITGGAVPIYWGDEGTVREIFNAEAYVSWDPARPEQALARIAALERDSALYGKMLSREILAPQAVRSRPNCGTAASTYFDSGGQKRDYLSVFDEVEVRTISPASGTVVLVMTCGAMVRTKCGAGWCAEATNPGNGVSGAGEYLRSVLI